MNQIGTIFCAASLLFLIGLISTSQAGKVIYKDCGSKTGKLTKLVVSNCDLEPGKSRRSSANRCVFRVGTNVSMEAQFVPRINSTVANVKIYGIIGMVPIPFYIDPDACTHWSCKCPLLSDVSNLIRISLPILSAYPALDVTTRVMLQDSNKKNVFCFEFPAKIEHQQSSVYQ